MAEQNEPQFAQSESRLFDRDRSLDSDDGVSLRELAIVPLKRKRAVLIFALLGLLGGIVVALTMTPRYRATATIELNEDGNGGVSGLSDLASDATGGSDALKVKIQTETAVIKDDSIALAVMSKMGMLRLEQTGLFSTEPGRIVSMDALPAIRREDLIHGFEGNLNVREVDNSRLIAITYTSVEPAKAANVANEVVSEYRAYLLRSNYSSSKEVSQWLANQLSGLSDQVTKTEQAVGAFEHSHNLSSSMPALASLTQGASPTSTLASGGGRGAGNGMRIPELDRLTTLNEEVTQAEAQRVADDAIYHLIETQKPGVVASLASSTLPGISNSTVISQGNGLEILNALREQEAAARVTYADISTKYGARNPRLIEVENQLKSLQIQIDAEMDKIRQRAKNDLTLAEQNEKSLRSAFEAQKIVTSKMNDDVVKLGMLMEQANSSRELYDLLFAKLQEANIDSGSSAVKVTIADPARPPGRPYVPRRTVFPLAGLMGGAFLGVALAYLLESQDDTLADSSQVEALAGAPVLGLIPFHKGKSRPPTDGLLAKETSPFLTDSEGATAEAMRSLRSGLALSGVGRRLKVLAITSALGREGKSFITYNLGLAFAATGLNVLIIDADFRRPRQQSLFRLSHMDGLSNLLAGMGTFDEALQRHSVVSNLSLLSSGERTPNASELLESGEVAKVIQAAREKFDLVLIDNSPVLPVADPIQIASHCDATIGVLRSGQTSRKALRRFMQTLSRNRIHLLGLVIGAVEMSASEYRSVYGYNVKKYYGKQ